MKYLDAFNEFMINQGWEIDYRGLLFKDGKIIDTNLFIEKRKYFRDNIYYKNDKQLKLF